MHNTADLKRSLDAQGINALDSQIEKCLAYLTLLTQWNQKHNLTRIETGAQWNLHILDSLSILSLCSGERILDVGSGAGMPGIPLSIFLPDQHFYLLDSSQKKSIFIKYAANKLDLLNVTSVNSLVEQYNSDEKFNIILSRAFSSLNKFVECSSHLLAKNGKLIAMKGKVAEEPVDGIPDGFEIEEIVNLKVPGVASRHAVIISRKS